MRCGGCSVTREVYRSRIMRKPMTRSAKNQRLLGRATQLFARADAHREAPREELGIAVNCGNQLKKLRGRVGEKAFLGVDRHGPELRGRMARASMERYHRINSRRLI